MRVDGSLDTPCVCAHIVTRRPLAALLDGLAFAAASCVDMVLDLRIELRLELELKRNQMKYEVHVRTKDIRSCTLTRIFQLP